MENEPLRTHSLFRAHTFVCLHKYDVRLLRAADGQRAINDEAVGFIHLLVPSKAFYTSSKKNKNLILMNTRVCLEKQ